ncbi:MAG: hypothetical protein GY913_25335 [Proteobacteria bacterium]|nr:hypothetical protein [Pseudomonadota bacterium]MCP4920237.1 hypothetical protein [Pseudomonadota bacterium]
MKHASLLLLLALVACNGGSGPAEGEESPISYIDSDEDTILDMHEGYGQTGEYDDAGEPIEASEDADGDGTPDHLDTDSDDDGILDKDEAGDADVLTLPWDSDADGIADFRDLDSDDNCIPDADEGGTDTDNDGVGDFADLDDDGDGINDAIELGDDCTELDSDGDGDPDYHDLDSDGDGIGDLYEGGVTQWEDEPQDSDADGIPDYLDSDSDNNGVADSIEGGVGGPQEEPVDTDGDGIYDFADTDDDGDGLSDLDELNVYGTNPWDDDTDGDGFSDGAELSSGSDPLDADSIVEGLYVTVEERATVEEDFAFTLNVQMGDIAFLLDTTCSMSATVNAMSSEFSQIVSTLSTSLPDGEYGVATYDDYAYGGYGSTYYGDKPFELRQQITSNVSKVQSTLSSIPLHGGSDGPESGMEALYQGLVGDGYDQNCNGRYDSSTDVRSYVSYSGDAFSGSESGSETSDSGGGSNGGFGFRDYALPVIVYATDNYLRDPDSSGTSYSGSPGGCPLDAGRNDVVAAANDQGAYLIGISTYSSLPTSQMKQLANQTGSTIGGSELVYSWSGNSSTLRKTITDAIEDLVTSVQFDYVSLQVENDPHGFVTSIDPEQYSLGGAVNGQEIDFKLDFRGVVAATDEDQIFTLTLNIVGDDTVLLDTLDILVLVPGRSY